ncbi:MAG: phytoene/squalene synthase family protein [Devosiaceae bacterium]
MSSDPTAFATNHLRTHGFDWYAALQFAAADKRSACIVVFAYLVEIERIRSLISDPMPGEIRLQWWRDTLSGTTHGAVEANPLAAALLQAIEHHSIPTAPLLAVLDARTFDLYDDVMPTMTDFEGYAGEVWSGPMSLAASILSGESPARFADVAGHGGVALAVARTLENLPIWVGRGQCFLPTEIMQQYGLTREMLQQQQPAGELEQTLRAFVTYGLEHLDKAREASSNLSGSTNPVWLPFTLAERTLSEAHNWSADPYQSALTTPRWRKLYRLWRASKRMPVF